MSFSFIQRFGAYMSNPHCPLSNPQVTVGITTVVYWGMVEAGIGIFVACVPTLQVLVRRRTWRTTNHSNTAVTGRSSGTYSGPNPRLFGSRSSKSQRGIQIDHTIDVSYGIQDSNPILAGSETWVHHNGRSDDGSHDIEMQTGILKADPVETRSAY